MNGRCAIGNSVQIAAGRFAFAIVQIEQLFAAHDRVILAQLRIDMLEDLLGFFHQVVDVRERLQSGIVQRIAIEIAVPRAQPIYTQPLLRPRINASGGRHDDFLDRSVERFAIGGRVIKAQQFAPAIFADNPCSRH